MAAVVGRRIKCERVYAGFRQQDLARAIGISQASLSRIERERRAPTFAEIARIAVQLRRPLEAFIGPPPAEARCGWERRLMLRPLQLD